MGERCAAAMRIVAWLKPMSAHAIDGVELSAWSCQHKKKKVGAALFRAHTIAWELSAVCVLCSLLLLGVVRSVCVSSSSEGCPPLLLMHHRRRRE